MSRLLRQVEHRLNIKAKPKPAEPDALDGHMAKAIKQAVQPEVEAQVREHLRDLPALVREEVQQTATAQMDLLARKHARTQMEDRPAVPPHRRDFTDKPLSSEWPDPPPRTAPPRDFTMNVQRDELGRIKTFTVGSDAKFELQRNGEGKTVRVVKLD